MTCSTVIKLTDVKKMPLGKLSKAQLAKGFEALVEIEEAIKSNARGTKLSELSSKFYTLIPHSFGRKLPPTISQLERVQNKKDMLLVRPQSCQALIGWLLLQPSQSEPGMLVACYD